jgi:hypothetical protein
MALEADRGLIVKFYSRAEVNKAKSWGERVTDNNNVHLPDLDTKAAGRPIVEDLDYITIQIPTVAYADSIVDRPVMYCRGKVPEDKTKIPASCEAENTPLACDVHRFWTRWQSYAAGISGHPEGTDLKVWPGITRGQAEELAGGHQIYTVEQLAALNDSNVAGQWVALRQRARDYLKESNKQVTAGELADRDRQIKALEEKDAERDAKQRQMEAQIAELVSAQSAASKNEKSKPQTSTK